MRTVAEILERWGRGRVEKLKTLHRQAGQRASGRTEREFASEVTASGGKYALKIFGAPWIEFLERGRGLTRRPGRGVVIERIKQWIQDKGLAGKLNPYAVTKVIHEQGTLMHRTGRNYTGAKNPVSKAFPGEEIEEVLREIGAEFETSISSEILKAWRQ